MVKKDIKLELMLSQLYQSPCPFMELFDKHSEVVVVGVIMVPLTPRNAANEEKLFLLAFLYICWLV